MCSFGLPGLSGTAADANAAGACSGSGHKLTGAGPKLPEFMGSKGKG